MTPLSISNRNPQSTDSERMLLARLAMASTYGVGFASAARTTSTTTASIDTGGFRVLTVFLNVTAVPGSGGLSVSVDMLDPVSGQWSNCNFTSAPSVASVGLTQYQMPAGLVASTACTVAGLTPQIRVRVTAASAASYTYSLSYVLSN